MAHLSHSFEDVSYHGSPSYHCEFCDCWKQSVEASLPCPKADEILSRREKEKEIQEKYEYQRMLAERERFEYLHAKYGNL